MDFIRKLLPKFQKRNSIANLSTETSQPKSLPPISNTYSTNMNNNLTNEDTVENMNTEGHSTVTSQHFDAIYSKDGQVLFEGVSNISENNQLENIGFEELIDLTRDSEETISTLEHINEFENICKSFNNENSNIENKDITLPNLDEINDFINTSTSNYVLLVKDKSETNAICVENSSTIQNKHGTNIKEDLMEINISNEETSTAQIEDGSSHNENSGQKDDIISNSNQNAENNLEQSSNVLDTISISSEENQTINDGYNSSDFEFISETEAKMDSFIINFKNDDKLSKNEDILEDIDPGEGPSGLNNRDIRQNHVLPEGEAYLDLFQGPYNPVLPWSDIIVLENKSIRPSPMNAQYEGVGFEKQLQRRYEPDSSEEEYADEAKESIKKILFLYPGENRKRRRRRR